MKPHSLLQGPKNWTALFLLAVIAALAPHVSAQEAAHPQYYELRVYSTKSAAQQKLVNDYWQNAAVPAYNRMGIGPIGVFTELKDSPTNSVYVLVPCDSLEIFAAIPARLAADAVYQQASASYLARPKGSPAFERIGSWLSVAFDPMGKIQLPPSSATKAPWVFELRVYQSPTESKGINKVQMFNSGEVPLMKEVGLCPVFFGQTLVGPQMPNLIYMVSGENRQVHQKHWDAFNVSPIWQRLKNDPQYQDNVSRGISTFLKRTSASQI